MALIMSPPLKFRSAVDHLRHLILVHILKSNFFDTHFNITPTKQAGANSLPWIL